MRLIAFVSPAETILSIFSRRSLIGNLIKRDISTRYKGSVLGILWSFLTPLTMLVVYTFVFSVVFAARWEQSQSRTEFAVVLFIGLMLFNLVSEVLNRSPVLIIGNVNFVKKVVFPLEVLSVVAVGSTLFHLTASFVVWLLVYAVLYGMPHATCLYFPLILVPLCFFALGLSWFFAALGVYLRDLGQAITLVTTMLMFLSPIFYPISALPPAFQSLLHYNPLSFLIEQARGLLMWHQTPDWGQLALVTVLSMAVAYLGLCWFQKMRGGFADVL
jgi:lipopolysaccharide transport system permease protein